MNSSRKSSQFAAAVAAVSLFSIIDCAYGQSTLRSARPTVHDGIYSVLIVTRKGTCDKTYLWTIAVSGGRVSSPGLTPLEASGQINSQGVVSLAFRGFNEIARAVGRLNGRRGSGTWSSQTMACAGTWHAQRQS